MSNIGITFAKQADGFRAWFPVVRSTGILRTGAGSGDFTATIVEPNDSASNTPTVTESSEKPGLYTFLIPSSFITSNGVGDYGVVVEINITTNPKVTDVVHGILKVTARDVDDLDAIIDSVVADDLVVGTGSSATEVRTNTTKSDNFYDGMILVVVNSAGTVGRNISSYSNTNGAFTLDTALPFTPSSGDRAVVLSNNELIGQIFVNAILIPATL